MIELIFENGQSLIIPSACTVSRGDSLSLDVRKTYDKSRTSHDISRRRFKMAPTWSISYTLNRWHDPNLLRRLYELEDCVGKTANLLENDANNGLIIVKSVSFALNIDADGTITALQIGLSLLSARVPTPRDVYEIRTM